MSETPHIDIDYVAKLARLDMTEEEKSKLGAQLDDILGYFDKLNSVDVEDVELELKRYSCAFVANALPPSCEAGAPKRAGNGRSQGTKP